MAVVLGAVLLIVGVLAVAAVFLAVAGRWPSRSDLDPLVCPDPSAHLPNPAMFTEHGSGEGDD